MNEPETFNPVLLKTLFGKLVTACGGQEAAALRLGVSRQRVGQLCCIRNPENAREVPSFEKIWTLEQACGRSVVFGGLAGMVEPSASAPVNAVKETHELVQAAAELCPLAVNLDPTKPATVRAFSAGLEKVQREAADLAPLTNVVPMQGVK